LPSETANWGPDDEIGALDGISSDKIVESARLVKRGRVYDLSHILEYGIPQHWFHGEFFYSTFRRHGDSLKSLNSKNRMGAMNVRLEMADHTGTHIDSINHVSTDGRMYKDQIADEITGEFGTSRLGMENVPPILTRGVLLDIASLKGVEMLEGGYPITMKDVGDCLRENRIEIHRGDAVLFSTGWTILWMKDNARYLKSWPGLGEEVAEWLAGKGASIVGADTPGVEVEPNEDPEKIDSLHQLMVAKHGIRLLENLSLEEVRREKVLEFLFVCLPLRIKGGTGSPVTPIAVV
jgi:kynurenine formamidase